MPCFRLNAAFMSSLKIVLTLARLKLIIHCARALIIPRLISSTFQMGMNLALLIFVIELVDHFNKHRPFQLFLKILLISITLKTLYFENFFYWLIFSKQTYNNNVNLNVFRLTQESFLNVTIISLVR